jgi:hypothetical protein
MSGTTRRILTAKAIALIGLGLVLLIAAVVHRRSLQPVPPAGTVAGG